MELKQLLFGCTLALTGVGSAMATDVDTRNIVTSRSASEGGSRDGGNAEALGPDTANANASHECTAACSTGDSPDSNEALDRGSVPGPHPHASHHGSLGWQSLLPGSIQ